MIVLQAPHEFIQATSYFPDPEFQDEQNLIVATKIKYAMDGTLYSTTRKSQDYKLVYDFNLTRLKTLELIEYIKAYYTYNIRLTNAKSEIWVVKIVSDPLDFSAVAIQEINTVRIEFQGSLLSGPNSYLQCQSSS